MTRKLNLLIGAVALAFATRASAEITLYQGEGFRGRAVTTGHQIANLESTRFADRAGSVVVDSGEWQVCDRPGFGGRCVTLRAGSYDSIGSMGLDDGIASVRGVIHRTAYQEEPVPPPMSEPTYAFRQRPHERTYEVPVSSVRAIVGPPEQQCWVERERVEQREPNAGGAIAGAIIGGILGHQIGHGHGAPTAGGAIAGAAIGASVGGHGESYDQDVQHCRDIPPGPPAYWDVTYYFRNAEHHVQMSQPPGATILVNGDGEPRQ